MDRNKLLLEEISVATFDPTPELAPAGTYGVAQRLEPSISGEPTFDSYPNCGTGQITGTCP